MNRIQKILEQYKIITLLQSMTQILEWDSEVNLPSGGYAYRAEQTAWLAGELHRKLTAPAFTEMVLSDFPEAKEIQLDEIAHIRRMVELELKIPAQLREQKARLTAKAGGLWEKAKKTGDDQQFLPVLTEIIQLEKDYCACKGFTSDPYDALLSDYDRGLSYSFVEELFNQLVPALQELLKNAKEDSGELRLFMAAAQQEKISNAVMKELGLSPENTRLDVSTHPFTSTLGISDVRITTNYDEQNFTSSLFSTLHEGGHALYELGIQELFGDSPCAQITSLAQHESQSRFFENIIGRNRAFSEYFFPKIQTLVSPVLHKVNIETYQHCINSVSYTPIRVDSDELYYNLHIALRTKMEHALINGTLNPKEINDAWNNEFENLFGKKLHDKRNGYMQDVHWSSGLFGYFPTYTIGNLIAAQTAQKLNHDTGILSKPFCDESIPQIRKWLRENFYIHGNRLCTEDFVQKVTGTALNSQPFIQDLKERYCQE